MTFSLKQALIIFAAFLVLAELSNQNSVRVNKRQADEDNQLYDLNESQNQDESYVENSSDEPVIDDYSLIETDEPLQDPEIDYQEDSIVDEQVFQDENENQSTDEELSASTDSSISKQVESSSPFTDIQIENNTADENSIDIDQTEALISETTTLQPTTIELMEDETEATTEEIEATTEEKEATTEEIEATTEEIEATTEDIEATTEETVQESVKEVFVTEPVEETTVVIETTTVASEDENDDFDKEGENQALDDDVSSSTEPSEDQDESLNTNESESESDNQVVVDEGDKVVSEYEVELDNKNKEEVEEGDEVVSEYETEHLKEEESTTTVPTTTSTTPAPKHTIWFRPTMATLYNDSFNDESHISANCPSLSCEFGYKTDLYGKPICACFNPCYEKKCGLNVCKIEKLTDTKFIGACYDPSKIERPLHCHLPISTGSCKNYTSRFYFNSFSQRCFHFIFTGCNQNGNNFPTWEKCEMECNTCSLPASRGPCHGNIIRYYFDTSKRECVAFNWGGCKGNDNNFSSRKHCEDSCLFRKEGALFLHGMPIRTIRRYNAVNKDQN